MSVTRAPHLAIAALAAGFSYSGVATLALYQNTFRAPAAAGPAATIDAHVALLDAVSAETIRMAVDRAGWPIHAEVSLVEAGAIPLSLEDSTRIRFSLAYLLYPRRIWARSAAAAQLAASERGERYVIEVGGASAFPEALSRRVTPSLRLVELQ